MTYKGFFQLKFYTVPCFKANTTGLPKGQLLSQHMFGIIKPMPYRLFCLGKINAHTDDLEKPWNIKLLSESKANKVPGRASPELTVNL